MGRWMALAGAALLAGCLRTIPIGAPANTPGGGGGANGGGSGGSVSGSAAVQEMAGLVNAHRRSVGCPALTWLPGAAAAAQAHSEDMARRGYFDHRSPDGRQPWDRLAAQGIAYRMVAENIAHTPTMSAGETLRGWIASRGHRENLENCAYTHHGIGLAGARWTHVFVTPR